MAHTAVTRAWTIKPNNRILCPSIGTALSILLYELKGMLVDGGYQVLGSSNANFGEIDQFDRWTSPDHAAIRGNGNKAIQSWMLLRDDAGVEVLLANQGKVDGVARISFSVKAGFRLAPTSTHQPIAEDERVVTTNLNLIGDTPSADRVWHGWIVDGRGFRFVTAHSGSVVGAWGIEAIDPVVVEPAVFTPPVVGFAYDRAGLGHREIVDTYVANRRGGVAWVDIASVGIPLELGGGTTEQALGGSSVQQVFGGVQPELQGGVGYPMTALSWWSQTVAARGKLGDRIDWWLGRTKQPDGMTYAGLTFINLNDSVWPWDGVTPPRMR